MLDGLQTEDDVECLAAKGEGRGIGEDAPHAQRCRGGVPQCIDAHHEGSRLAGEGQLDGTVAPANVEDSRNSDSFPRIGFYEVTHHLPPPQPLLEPLCDEDVALAGHGRGITGAQFGVARCGQWFGVEQRMFAARQETAEEPAERHASSTRMGKTMACNPSNCRRRWMAFGVSLCRMR